MELLDATPRRGVLAGLGAMLVAPPLLTADRGDQGGVSGVLSSTQSGGVAAERSNAADLLRDFIRMRTAPDLAPVLWVYSGVLVVKPDGEVARPVARIEGLSRSRATPRPDGSWLWELDEAGYYCDLESGRPATELLNPFTGVTVKTKHYRSPQALSFTRAGIVPANPLPPGIDFRGEITRLAEVAGTVALTEDLYVKMAARATSGEQPARPPRYAASLATFTTLRRNFALPQGAWIDCQFNYTTLNSFVEWLGLVGKGGVQDMRIVGIKCRMDDRDAVPEWLRARVKADHPDLLA
jgi:hypothetical protein